MSMIEMDEADLQHCLPPFKFILIEGIDIFPQIACDHAKWAGLDFPDCSYCGQFSFNKSSAEPRIFSLKLLTFTKAVDFRNKVKSPKETREII